EPQGRNPHVRHETAGIYCVLRRRGGRVVPAAGDSFLGGGQLNRRRLAMAKSISGLESLFATLPTELSDSLFAKARPVSLATSQTLFVEGDKGDGCYRVEEGLLKASVAIATGGERTLAILGPGSIVGELSIIDSAPRSASVTALRDSKLSF